MNRLGDLMLGVRNCMVKWGNLKWGEKVLIVSDTKVDPQLIKAFEVCAKYEGAKVTVMIMEPPKLEHQEPPAEVAEAMKTVDLVIMVPNMLTAHTQASFDAQQNGARLMFIGPSLEAMASDGAKFPAEIIFKITTKVAEQWIKGKKITVKCEKGTNLTANIYPQHVIGLEGAGAPLGSKTIPGKPRRGRFAAWEGGFGTVGIWPEWTTEGVIYFDAVQGFSGVLKEPLKVEVEKGLIVNLEGPKEVVAYLNKIYEKYGKDAKHIGEIMIGTNPMVNFYEGFKDPTHLQAHRAAGTVHIAMGNSVDDFRTVKPGVHLDCCIINPTIIIDEEICEDNGKLLVLDDPEIKNLMKQFGY